VSRARARFRICGVEGGDRVLPATRLEDLRAHGLPKFPDPSRNGNLEINGRADGISAPGLRHANKFCQHLLPIPTPSQADLERAESEALKYTGCMRAHGLSNFPDPRISNGAISFGAVGGAVQVRAECLPFAYARKRAY
jgi:hypothetical protein